MCSEESSTQTREDRRLLTEINAQRQNYFNRVHPVNQTVKRLPLGATQMPIQTTTFKSKPLSHFCHKKNQYRVLAAVKVLIKTGLEAFIKSPAPVYKYVSELCSL